MIKLPKLPYEFNALEPTISAKTVEFHYTKHHQGYVNKLNGLIEGTNYEGKTLEEIIKTGKLAEMINETFGSFDKFKEEFSTKAATLFGSGWAWLVLDNGQLKITGTSNAGSPLTEGQKPILTCDVWEHAYYLDYQNLRPKYIENFWELVDWKKIEERL